jgi:hypothetical protein
VALPTAAIRALIEAMVLEPDGATGYSRSGRCGFESGAHSFRPAFDDSLKYRQGLTRSVGVQQERDSLGTVRRLRELGVSRLVFQASVNNEPNSVVLEWKVRARFRPLRLGRGSRRAH